jgi:CubicO group peptidase (beta-lactamase class C family)
MRLKNALMAIAAAASLLLSGQAAAADQTPSPTTNASASIDALIAQRMSEAGMVGVGAAIIVGKKVVWMKGYGFADKAQSIPFTPHTVMNIGSISKTFTGAALMRAVEEGKLSLDADINTYLPFKVVNPYFPDARITLRQLATHTSGIADRWAVYEGTYHYGGDSPEPLGEFLKDYFAPDGKHYAKDNFLNAKPGTHREYSNIGAGLVGYIVEIAVGEKLNAYTKRRFFAPLQMEDTGWFLSDIALANHSRLYVSQSGLAVPIPLYGVTTYPDGGVRTSVADLSKFFIALLNEGEYEGTRILRKRSANEMLRFEYTAANKPENVDLKEKNSGIFWQSKFNVTRMGHGGTDPGLKTEMLTDLSKEIGVILFTNTSLDDQGMRSYAAIFEDLWKQAEALKAAEKSALRER